MPTTTLPPAPTSQPTAFASARNPNGHEPSPEAIANEDQRSNVPLNANAWNGISFLSEDDRRLLSWFHLHALDERLSNKKLAPILGYDHSNVGRILKGTYSPESTEVWNNIVSRVRDYYDRVGAPAAIGGCDREPEFILTGAAEMFWQGLDFASRGGFSIIAGPSGMGKTKTAKTWSQQHPGRLIRVNAPVVGGPSALLRRVAQRVGRAWRKRSTDELQIDLQWRLRGLVLMIDQGTLLVPKGKEIQAKSLEVLQQLQEEGVGIVLSLTWRAVESMADMTYQIEQVTGRAEIFRAPEIERAEISHVARQFGDFSEKTISALYELAQKPGAFRDVVKVLNAADRAARLLKRPKITDNLIAEALKNRFERMGNEDPFASDAPSNRKRTR
jgi:hypothetical protein